MLRSVYNHIFGLVLTHEKVKPRNAASRIIVDVMMHKGLVHTSKDLTAAGVHIAKLQGHMEDQYREQPLHPVSEQQGVEGASV